MKLWDKGDGVDKEIERFTVGDDYLLDARLVRYDCIASMAHARMLEAIGVLGVDELAALTAGLREIIELAGKGEFPIAPEDEDCHTAIEGFLTTRCGEAGKKIHTARSRNDQVLTALRLYEKDALAEIRGRLLDLRTALRETSARIGHVPIPGYTHTRKAMPTEIGTWLGAFADAAADDARLLEAIEELIDQSPLGSAAGFGVPVFELDKDMTADEMGFSRVMENPIYAQMSRGKFEITILNGLGQIMLDLNRLATDLIFFSAEEFGFVTLPGAYCTGSSIMPQKANPDVLELVRAKYHVVVGDEIALKGMIGNLISGYHRDMQLTKGPLMGAIDTTEACLRMMTLVVSGIEANEKRSAEAMTEELFATEEAYRLVEEGMPFREAYRVVGKRFSGERDSE